MRRLHLLGLLVATSASAQSFTDDFEGGTAAWATLEVTPGISIAVNRDAAHRGAQGLRVADTDATPTNRQGTTLGRSVSLFGAAAYSRGWVRVRSANQAGSTVFLSTSWRQGSTYAAAAFWQLEGTSLVAGTEPFGPGGKVTLTARVGPVDAGWHLLETAVLGIGTDAGVVASFIDGEQVARFDSLGAEALITDFDVGVVYGQGAHLWEADVDDLGLATKPFPQRLTLEVAPEIVETRCTALTVGVTSTLPSPTGGSAGPLSVSAPVTLAVEGLGALFADPACEQPVTNPVLTQAGRQLFFRAPDAGPFEARVSDVERDLLPARQPFASVPLTGTAPTQREASYFALACGSGPSSVPSWFLLVSIARRWRRRSRE